MNKDEIILEYLRQLEEENNIRAGNTYDKLRGNVTGANIFGNNLQIAGDSLKNNVNSEFARKIGGQMSNIGGPVANNTYALSNTLNKPVNYFKGHANGAINAAMQKIGLANTAATGAGAAGAAGTTAGTAAGTTGATTGATAAGTAAGTTAATTGATAAGTAAGTGAAAGGAAGAGAGGAAAGGAAAGGSGAAAAAGPIAALAFMGLMGTNRKRAKKSGQALMKHTTQMAEADNQESDARLAQSQQNAAALQEQANQALQGGLTGAVAPATTYDPISDYQNYLRQNGYSDEVVNGVSQGLNSGNKEIASWIDQYNAGTDGQANPIRIPQTEEEIAAARAGSFNVPIQTGGIDSNDKQGILDKLINGITDFSKGYQENRNTAFAPENLRPDDKKGKMNKLGEAVGTLSRAAQKPAMQALIAGGLSTALTGNPLYGAGMAQKFGSQRAMTDIYKDVLAKQGINVDPGMFGVISSKDMDAIMTPELKKIYYQSLADWRNQKLANDKEYKDQKLEIDKQNADSKAIQAGAAATRANKYNGGGSTKVENKPHYGEALAEYVKIANSGDFDAMEFARQEFIKRYGIDPNKKVGL